MIESDKLIPEDQRTAQFWAEVGNSIHSSISVKSDFPSKNRDGKMPLLDLKVWVGEDVFFSSLAFIPKNVKVNISYHIPVPTVWK